MKKPEYKSDRQKYCHECGAVIVRHAEICPRCGEEQRIVQVVQHTRNQSIRSHRSNKSHVAAGILALVLGGFGVHRFYMGQWKLGLLYIAFSWTFIPGLIGFIEGIVTLVQGEEQFQNRLQ